MTELSTMPLFFLALILIAAWFGYRYVVKRQTRKRLLASQLSDHQRDLIGRQVPYVHRLPPALHATLEGKINLFLHQVAFYGCDGLDVTEEMELSIATQACLLVINTDTWYKNLTTILIYPDAFKSMRTEYDGYVVTERERIRSGESWSRGPVILSWKDTEQGALNDRDGHNLAFHEFAHQIDDLSGHTDGAPILSKGQSFARWERVIMDAFERHVAKVEKGHKTVLDAYGATATAEFFAVAVEVFFEKPRALKDDEPAVYQELSALFRLDPAAWD